MLFILIEECVLAAGMQVFTNPLAQWLLLVVLVVVVIQGVRGLLSGVMKIDILMLSKQEWKCLHKAISYLALGA